jgi:hypothetical protein
MRQKVNAETLKKFMEAIGRSGRKNVRIYLVGGATAVLLGWRDTTIDVDLKVVPEANEVLKTLPQLKEQLHINIELASPDDFIPALPGWQERSGFIGREGTIDFFYYDFYGQALAKIERGHSTDLRDVHEMIERGLIEPARLFELFSRIEDQLYKYPAIDAKSFRRAVEKFIQDVS